MLRRHWLSFLGALALAFVVGGNARAVDTAATACCCGNVCCTSSTCCDHGCCCD